MPEQIERGFLSIVAATPGAWGSVRDRITADHFTDDRYRALFGAMEPLAERGMIDEAMLLERLETSGRIGAAGGVATVQSVLSGRAQRDMLEHYVAEMEQHYARRVIERALFRAQRMLDESEPDSFTETAQEIEQLLMRALRSPNGQFEAVTGSQALTDALEMMQRAKDSVDGLLGYSTGLECLDRMLGGLEPGTFTILLGPPGVGKTALWQQIALKVSRHIPVGLVELEMTPAQLAMRALASLSQVSFHKIRRATLREDEMAKVSESMGVYELLPIHIAPDGVQSLSQLKVWARRAVFESGIGALFVDNLKIVDVPGKEERQRIDTVTRELKLLSRELGIPVFAIHHIHRLKPGQRPTLTSGFGSSGAEQDADNLLALWNPDPDGGPFDMRLEGLKVRNDRPGIARLSFNGAWMRFTELTDGGSVL